MSGYTGKELSGILGISQRSFSNKINNKTSFNTNEVDLLCELLNITEDRDKINIFLGESSHNRDE